MSSFHGKPAEYAEKGFALFSEFFSPDEIASIAPLVFDVDRRWRESERDSNLVNSAYLTGRDLLPDSEERRRFFEFIARDKLVALAEILLRSPGRFLNTQLFFNPENPEKRNYWHRDTQYLGVDEEEQIKIMSRDFVLHFRIPLREDPGLEFIPGTHKRWDTPEERDIRLELNARDNFEELENSVRVPHTPGDLLVFSAHLIHRGIYGLDRMALDILYTNFPEKHAQVEKFGHFPDDEILRELDNRRIFDFTPAD